MIFSDYNELTSELTDRVASALANRPDMDIKTGHSNQSCSAYVNFDFMEADEDGDYLDSFGGCKVRFSDHADRYGSDITIRFNDALDNDEAGNVDLADWRMDEMVAEAIAFVLKQFKDQNADFA